MVDADNKIIVIDDDPTGSQTVHSCLLLTRWDVETLVIALRDAAPLFFILSNTRGMVGSGRRRSPATSAGICGWHWIEQQRRGGRCGLFW